MNNFYVYVYLDPLISGKYEYGDYKFDFEPFYVGKGKNKRLYYHITEAERYYESGFNRDRVNISKVEKIKNIIDVVIIYRKMNQLKLKWILLNVLVELI